MTYSGYAILDGMADALLLLYAILEAADMHMECHDMRMETKYEFVVFRFTGKRALRPEEKCMLWNPIFSYNVDRLDRCAHDDGVGRYCRTMEFLKDYP